MPITATQPSPAAGRLFGAIERRPPPRPTDEPRQQPRPAEPRLRVVEVCA